MPDSLYPPASRALSDTRKRLAPEIDQDKAIDRRRRRPCHAVPLLHPRPHQSRYAAWRDTGGTHGSDLGGGRDARRRRIHAFGLDEMEKASPRE